MKLIRRFKHVIQALVAVLLTALLLSACTSMQDWWHGNGSAVKNQPQAKHSSQDFWKLYAKRLEFSRYHESNPSVQAQIHWIQKHPLYFKLVIKNARPYIYYIYQQVATRNMPAELALMPMIESSYDPFRYSRVGATGLWDLMPGTASGLGVRINWWYDGRRDVIESTSAALSFLSYLHHHLHSWQLAIPGYDAGAGLIDKAVRANKREHLSTQLWSLNLPLETKAYLPRLLAIAAIIRHPERYGFQIPILANEPQFASFTMTRQISLSEIAHMSGASLAVIRKLNPGFRRAVTEPDITYTCLIPSVNTDQFSKNLQRHKPHKKYAMWRRYKVRSGDTLGAIARKFHTRQVNIKKINHINDGNKLHVGAVLSIAVNSEHLQSMPASDRSSHYRSHHKKRSKIRSSVGEDSIPGPHQNNYVVKKRDSLQSIAHRYHVTPQTIRFWNQLRYHHVLKPGEKLTLWIGKHNPSLGRKNRSVYHVKRGDSLCLIAHHHHMLLPALLAANPHLSPKAVLKQGQTVIVYG